MDKVRLNNFILWCKNWYYPVDNKMNIITQAKKILALDGYLSCNNPISIALIFIDELVEKGTIKPISLFVWNEEINKYKLVYECDYQSALMYRIRNFFAFECNKLQLTPPVYSRKIYKLGFMGPSYMGNSYKMLNYKARKIFDIY
ncbi:hypothetical protein [Clostridium sp.]|uniref:hypothetical protein n=1 Tax=Clostridium sp. TaxID=1506 RepID=UPI0025C367A6|nr:hypothetical protein [Clostridium sp.]